MMSVSEAMCVAETVELQIRHGSYSPSTRERALVTLFFQVKKDLLTKDRT